MPALVAIPWLIPLIAGAATAASAGVSIHSALEQPKDNSAATTAQLAAEQAQQTAQQTAEQKVAFLAARPGVQANTGGSLVGNAFNTATAGQAGVPSDLGSIAKYLSGTGSSSSTPISGGTTTPNSGGAANDQDLSGLATLLKGAA